MAKVRIRAGVCGHVTDVSGKMTDEGSVELDVHSDCPSVRRLAEQVSEVDPMREITYRGDGPQVLEEARQCLPHPACPVPSGILKCVEASSGLALPRDADIHFPPEEGGNP